MDLLQMSYIGSILIILITIIRALFINKLPKRTFLLLWWIAVFKLIIPFSLPFGFNIYSLLSLYTDGSIFGANQSGGLEEAISINELHGFNITDTVTEQAYPHLINNFGSIWAVIWGIGVALCAVFFAVSYIKCIKRFCTSLPVTNEFINKWLKNVKIKRSIQIRESDWVLAPLTYGIINPVILVPKKMDWSNEEQTGFVLMHELTHIKRLDAITKLVLVLTACIHWFNPLVWVMYTLFNRDIELACDEAVVSVLMPALTFPYI